MILTVDLNPIINRRYFISDFQCGKSYTAYDVQYRPGGKAIDIGLIVKSFGEPVKITGFVGGRNGDYIIEALDNMDIDYSFVNIKEEIRTSTRILTEYGVETEIIERSPSLSNEEVLEFYRNYREMIKETEIICCSGPLPNGMPEDTYRDLILMAKEEGKKVFLDASGEALKQGIKASPFLIKPNRDELEEYMGFILTNENEIIKAANYIMENGIEIVIVSLGKAGAIVVYQGHSYKIKMPSIDLVNSNGAGSAMLAGLAVSILRNYDFEHMLKVTAACGGASVMERDTGTIDMVNMKTIMNEVEIEKKKIW
ncbi:MAG: 1-phosphofructokinase family hexose kinase [Tissierellia bacterium]|nr:1-phosphofructokinase family hexose kinase [Tissierellia bacterium]